MTAGFNRIRATRATIRVVELLLSRMLSERQLTMQRGTSKEEFLGEDDQWAWNKLLLDLGCEVRGLHALRCWVCVSRCQRSEW